jgi:hypothetical protein
MRYINSSINAAEFRMGEGDGSFQFHTAPSGTAGNTISFTQAMTLDASGNLGVGDTAPANYGRFVVTGNPASGPQMSVNASTGQALLNWYENAVGRFSLRTLNGSAGIAFYDTFNGAERARITSGGDLLVGTTSGSYRLTLTVASGADREILLAGVSGASNGFSVKWNHSTTTTRVNIANIPTSSAGLTAGDLWSDGGTIKIA